MVIDARSLPDREELVTDVCVIGGGAAGITLAKELTGTPLQVALLESGNFAADPQTQSLYQGEANAGLPYYPLHGARLRYFGGTTNHWGGYCQPLGDEDFVRRDWLPNSGWPLTKAELWPFYERAQSLLGLDPAGWGLDFWQKQDRYPAWPLATERIITRVAQISPVPLRRLGQQHRETLTAAENVTIFLNANVTQIVADEMGTAISHLAVATLTGNQFTVSARVFVLAAGGIENPRLLLLSNQQFPAGLGNQHDLVGRFFLEHPRFMAGVMMPFDPHIATGFYGLHKVKDKPIKGYLSLTPEVKEAKQLTDVQVRLSPVYADSFVQAFESQDVASLRAIVRMVTGQRPFDDFGYHVRNVALDLMNLQPLIVPSAPLPLINPIQVARLISLVNDSAETLLPEEIGDIMTFVFEELFNYIPIKHIELIARIDPIPNPDSRVTLSDELDALGQRQVRLHWALSPMDKQSVRRTLEILAAELGQVGLGRLRIDLDADDTIWPADVRGGYHHMGTTRMHQDPRQGVVDKNCRVHGLDNLFVAGSSVFPMAGLGTPTLTLIALALRLADHLKKGYA